MIPLKLPRELTADSRKVYSRALNGLGWNSDPAVAAAGAEIEAAGLGRLSVVDDRHCLSVVAVHSAFTVARRGGERDARLGYVEFRTQDYGVGPDGALVACLDGAVIDQGNVGRDPWPTWRFRVLHHEATDYEHDSCRVACFDVAALTPTWMGGAMNEYTGFLTEAQAWPTGTDLTEDTACSNCETGHPFGPYTPPGRDDLKALIGSKVTVRVYSQALVDTQGRLLDKSS